MTGRKILSLRRRPVPVTDPADQVVLAGVVLKCTRCGDKWQARLGPFGDEVADSDARCPHCAEQSPEPPQAA